MSIRWMSGLAPAGLLVDFLLVGFMGLGFFDSALLFRTSGGMTICPAVTLPRQTNASSVHIGFRRRNISVP